MYLSRVQIDFSNRRKIKDLLHLGAYHNWVESAFRNIEKSGERTRKLWRIDSLQGNKYLLVLSQEKPDVNALEKYGVKNSAQIKSYDKLINSVENGKKYRFRATLNPVHSIKSEKSERGRGRGRGRVVPHITVEQQMKFLLDRAEKNGFLLKNDEFEIVERSFKVLKKSNQKDVRLSVVSYEGMLTVADKDAFVDLLIYGTGREKAYGCGLFTIIEV